MKFETIFRLKDELLKDVLYGQLTKAGYTTIHNHEKFLYAEGNAPYMLVAHLDTVHKEAPSIICYSKDGDYMMSPQGIGGDDRCGVYIILSLIKKLTFKPHILFTMDEEVGGIGADEYVTYVEQNQNAPELKYIIEYDRKGNNDCVFYHCGNEEFINFVEGFGFKEAYGTFSDISTIAPVLGVAAVNLSSGYYEPHTEHEYVSIKDMQRVIELSVKMLNTECEKFEYVEKYTYSSYYQKYVEVSFVPAHSVYLYSWYAKGYVLNEEYDVVIDKAGNFYRFDPDYQDLIKTTNIYPADIDDVPTYDEEVSFRFPMMGYSSYYSN